MPPPVPRTGGLADNLPTCDRCGAALVEHHCKLVCPRCGFQAGLQRPVMRVLVCGSRTWHDVVRLRRRLQQLPPGAVIVHGAARGADATAEAVAKALGFSTEPHPARWAVYGSRAGFVRNEQMLDSQPDLVLAFWDGQSRGTHHTIKGALRRGIPCEVITP